MAGSPNLTSHCNGGNSDNFSGEPPLLAPGSQVFLADSCNGGTGKCEEVPRAID